MSKILASFSTIQLNRKISSKSWIQRQTKDAFIKKSQKDKYRCRSAYKLIEMVEKYKIMSKGNVVVDCGGAPGSWAQVAVQYAYCKQIDTINPPIIPLIISFDKTPFRSIKDVTILTKDITSDSDQKSLIQYVNTSFRGANLVMSDMAPMASGIKSLDYDRHLILVQHLINLFYHIAKPQSHFICKIFSGFDNLNQHKYREIENFVKKFQFFKFVKPSACRKESSELYLLAKNYIGN